MQNGMVENGIMICRMAAEVNSLNWIKLPGRLSNGLGMRLDVNLNVRTCVCATVNISFYISLSLYHILYVDMFAGTMIKAYY